MLVFTTVFGPCPVAEAELQAASDGRPPQVKLMAVLKPVDAMMPTVVVADAPGLLTRTFDSETTANPDWTVKVTG